MDASLLKQLRSKSPGGSSAMADAAGLHPEGYSADELLGGKAGAKGEAEEDEEAGAGPLSFARAQLPKIRAQGPGGAKT